MGRFRARKDGKTTHGSSQDDTGKEGVMDAATQASELLKDHRDAIDRLDAILVYTLAERFKQTQAVGRLKAEHGLPPSDPDREARQMARLHQLATEADLDPDLAKKFLTFIISEVIRHHEKLQK
jgi:chorismate mutase